MTTVGWAADGRDTRPDTGADAWDAGVQSAMDLLGRRPLHEVTLEDVALHARLPLREVREQFSDLNGLAIAVIQEWNADRMRRVQINAGRDGAIPFLRDLLALSVADPACARVVLAAAGMAGIPDHPAAAPLQRMWVRFHATVQRSLAHDISVEREPDTMDPANGAEQLLSIYGGLQFQWLLRPNMDILAAYDRAVTRLRHGWSEAYVAPVWKI